MRRVAAVLCLGLAAAYHPPAPCDALEREKAWVAERAGAEVGALRIDAAWLQPVDQGAAPPRCTLSVAKSAARGEEVARIPSATLLHTANIHFTRLGASLRHRAAFQPLAPGGSSARAESFSEDGEKGGEEAALAQEERQALQQSWPWAAASSAAALVQDDHALLLALHILHEESASDPPSPWAPLLASLPRACVLPMCAGAGLLAEMRDDILRTHALQTRAEALALRAHLLPWLRSTAPHDMDLSRAGFLRAIAVARQRAVAVGGGEGGPLAIVPLVHAARQLPSAGPTPASGFDSVTSAFIVRSETAAPAGAELVLSRGRLPDRGVMDRFGALPLRQNPMETVLMDAAALPVGRGEEEEETEEMVAAREGVLAAHGVPRALWVPTVLPLTPQLVFAARLTVLSARPLHTLASTPPCAFHEELRGGRSGGGEEVGEGSACRPLSAPLEAAAMDRLARAALAKASPPGEPGLAEDDCTLFALSAACDAESSGGVSAADVWTWRMRYEFVRYRASRRRPYAALAAAATRIAVAQARLATGAHSPQSSQSAESQQSAQPAESPQHAQYSPSGRSAGDAARAPAYRVAVPPPMPSLGRATTPAAAAGHADAGPQLALRSFPAASRTTPPPPLSPSGPSSPQDTRPAAAAANAQNVLETATDAVGAATWRRGALSLGGTAVDAVQASADDVSPLSAMVDRSGREASTRSRAGPHRSLWTPSDARRVVRDAVRAVVTDASGVIEHVAQGEGEGRGEGEDTTQGTRTVQAPPGEAATRVRQAVESAWEQASSSRLTQRAAVDTGDVVAAAAASLASGSGSAAAAAGDGDPAAEYAQLHRLLHEEWRRFEAQMEKVVSEVAGRVDVTALLRSYGNALGAGVPVVQTPPRGEAPFDGARMERVEAVLDEAYEDGSLAGYSLEEAERVAIEAASSPQDEAKGECGEATYGEITPRGLAFLLHHANASSGDVFADIGSGVGRAVLQAALQFPLRAAVGIELSSSRHATACAALWAVAKRVRAGRSAAPGAGVTRVSLLRTDAIRTPLRPPLLPAPPQIVFANSVCFRPALLDRLEVALLDALPVGAVAFSAKQFPSEGEISGHQEAVLRKAAEESTDDSATDPMGAMSRAQAVLDGAAVGDTDRDSRMARLWCRYARLGKRFVQEAVVFLPMGWTVGHGMPVFQYRVRSEADAPWPGPRSDAACRDDGVDVASEEALPAEGRCDSELPSL